MASRDNPDFLSAKTIEGDKVVNASGDDLGKIEDLMIDLDNGRVGYAVLSFGGTLGLGDKLFAIPWQALSLRMHEHAFTLDIPKDVLEKAEGFDKDNWPVTRKEISRTYNYYGYQPYWQTGVTGRAGKPAGTRGMTESQGSTGPGSRESPDFLSASSIKSDKVINKDGDNIGKIEELMIDLQGGRIAYAVFSHGGFLGIGSKLFAIPWQSFSLRVREHAFVLNIPKETLDKEKGIDKDNWPLTREEIAKTFTYYGYQPYWQTGAVTGTVTGATVAAAAGASAGMGAETEPERKRKVTMPEETATERVTWTESEIRVPAETEAESSMRQERERLETERRTEEEKISQLERERMELEKQAETERERLARLEKEHAEAVRQAEIEKQKLAQLERELQEATRREKTEEVTRLENEMRKVKVQEETQRTRVAQLERELVEVERKAETEKESLDRLEKERIEAEKRTEAERQRVAQLEMERTEKEKQAETEKESLSRLEKERMETERQAEAERQRLVQLERERLEAERREIIGPERIAAMGGVEGRVSPDFMPANTIKGYKVVNMDGDDLGTVEDLMIDLNNGIVAYAALSLGGFLGMSDKLFAVPWPSLSYLSGKRAFILAVPKNILEKAEGFDRDKYPTTRDELIKSYNYYGYQPYWQRGMTREERVRQGRLETAEQLMAAEDKEEIEEKEMKETDPKKLAELEKRRKIAERREHKYD